MIWSNEYTLTTLDFLVTKMDAVQTRFCLDGVEKTYNRLCRSKTRYLRKNHRLDNNGNYYNSSDKYIHHNSQKDTSKSPSVILTNINRRQCSSCNVKNNFNSFFNGLEIQKTGSLHVILYCLVILISLLVVQTNAEPPELLKVSQFLLYPEMAWLGRRRISVNTQ